MNDDDKMNYFTCTCTCTPLVLAHGKAIPCSLQFLVAVDTADPFVVVKDIRERRRRVAVRVLNVDHILHGYAPLVNVVPKRAPD